MTYTIYFRQSSTKYLVQNEFTEECSQKQLYHSYSRAYAICTKSGRFWFRHHSFKKRVCLKKCILRQTRAHTY